MVAAPSCACPRAPFRHYLFYRIDVNNDIIELNESDNVGYFYIQFESENTTNDIVMENNIGLFVYKNYLFVQTSPNFSSEPFELDIINSIGQTIYNKEIEVFSGQNSFQLPENISQGIYLIRMNR